MTCQVLPFHASANGVAVFEALTTQLVALVHDKPVKLSSVNRGATGDASSDQAWPFHSSATGEPGSAPLPGPTAMHSALFTHATLDSDAILSPGDGRSEECKLLDRI